VETLRARRNRTKKEKNIEGKEQEEKGTVPKKAGPLGKKKRGEITSAKLATFSAQYKG